MGKYEGKETVNSKALSFYIGSILMPTRDGRPQRKLTAEEAYEKAVEWDERRKRG